MIRFDNLINFQFMIFFLMLVGYVLNKRGLVNRENRKCLNDLIINLVLPCNIIHSYFMEMNRGVLVAGGITLVISICIQCGYLFFNALLYRKVPRQRRMVLKYATLCPNAGFLGNPLIEGLYGAQGLFYASIFLIPQRIVMWTGGVACFTTTKGKDAFRQVMTHPCIIATEIGLAILLLQIPVPQMLVNTVNTVSSCTTALVMVVLGGILAEVDIRTVFTRMTLYYSAVRLLLLPGLVLAACYALGVDPLVTAVSAVLTGMPAGTTTAILAERYGGDAGFGVSCVFVSTVLSLITIPLLCTLIEVVFR